MKYNRGTTHTYPKAFAFFICLYSHCIWFIYRENV